MKVSEMEARGSKTLVAGEPMREPSWLVWTLMKGFRVVVLTVLWTGLGMGVGLFCGIIGVAAWSAIHAPDAGDGLGVPERFDSGCDLHAGAARSCGT